jgi:hypothetical protein
MTLKSIFIPPCPHFKRLILKKKKDPCLWVRAQGREFRKTKELRDFLFSSLNLDLSGPNKKNTAF